MVKSFYGGLTWEIYHVRTSLEKLSKKKWSFRAAQRSSFGHLVNKPMLSEPLKFVDEFLIEFLSYADTQVTAKNIIKNGLTNERKTLEMSN